MGRPRTLLEIGGAPLHPSPLEQAALVLIDHQREYVDGGIPLMGIDAAVTEAVRLLGLARRSGMPVFHVVHHGKPGSVLFDPEGPFVEIIQGLAPAEGETIVIKSLPNSFAKTDLYELIKATGRTELIVGGFATHMCVSATVRAALDLSLRTTVVAGATASRDLPNPLGGIVSAERVHEATLAALADRFAIIVPDTAALISHE